jgi:hypothetical protein
LCDELHVIYGDGLTNIEKTLFLCNIHWNGPKEMSHQLLVVMSLRTITFAKIKYFQTLQSIQAKNQTNLDENLDSN